MENKQSNPKQSPHVPKQRGRACLAAFLATMLAAPAGAVIDIPDDPLTTGARVAPNILFILDDSGSMNFVAMPNSITDYEDDANYGSVQRGLDDNPVDRSYLNNAVYYNPNVLYRPWLKADGNPMTGGTGIASVYTHWNYANGDDFNCSWRGCIDGTRDLRGSAESAFYVPKAGVTSSTNPSDFYRYQVSSGGVVVRNSNPVSLSGFPKGPLSSSMNAYTARTFTVPVTSGTSVLRISTTGGGTGIDLYLMRPNGSEACRSHNGNGSESCSVANPAAGNWEARVYRDNSATFSDVYLHAVTSAQVADTPTGRTQADELRNIATWYSYHRSRMKAAKAGASEAFDSLKGDVRVGYRTIHNRNTFNIPVTDGNDGRFVDNEDDPGTAQNEATSSRSSWYSRLHSASGSGGTPLLSALGSAGGYFSGSSHTGPYGPQADAGQLTCRQNFAILTTDGYWNSDSSSVGNADGSAGSAITGPGDPSYTYAPAAPFTDSFSNTLADVAMHYWKRDLRSEPYMTNNVPTSSANPAFWQHMVTFGISIGLSGRKGWSSVDEVPVNATWNDPTDTEDADRIDDLLHAAVNGRGAFVAASNPSEFAGGLSAALAAIAERTSSSSNVAANSVSLDTGSQIFSASYVSGIWTGRLTATEVSQAGVGDEAWTSSMPAWGSRRIFTSNDGSGANFPTTGQVASLARGGGPANFEVSGADNANYIRGEQRLESNRDGTLRIRTSLLGDIISSSPAYVRDTNTIYVGANDGMLHAFNAANGRELFAFVPNIIDFGALSTLSRGDYAHRYFVDGPVTVSSQRLTPNRNVLVGTLGRGGKGLYALDVTNPGSFDASDFKWERAETPGNNMGLVLGKPILSRVQGSTNAAVVIGNGVNSTSEQAALLVLDAETGGVIREISTLTGSADEPNGLFAPTGVYGPDGRTLAFVYAGDMLGNVWKFDLTNEAPGSWGVERIFTAVDSEGNAQPITAGLAIATHPITNDRWVFFGTGRYLTVEDAGSESVQSMYGFIDEDTPITRDELTERTVEVTDAAAGRRAFESRASLPSGSKGWYIDLPETGERIVQDAQVVSTFLVTASMMPSGNACEADGSGYINALNAFTGTSAGGSYFDTDGDGDTSDETVGDLPIGSINLGVGMPTLPNLLRGLLVAGGSGGGGPGGEGTLPPRWDRASWREIRGN